MNRKVSAVIVTINGSPVPSIVCTSSEEKEKASAVSTMFCTRPVSPLSRSTRPPAITPNTSGIVHAGCRTAHTKPQASITQQKMGKVAMTLELMAGVRMAWERAASSWRRKKAQIVRLAPVSRASKQCALIKPEMKTARQARQSFFCPARPENRENRVQSLAHCAGCASRASASCAISRPAVAQLKWPAPGRGRGGGAPRTAACSALMAAGP